ncbi:hypothetical protein FQN50_005428 [Emmonsiellopsis sp. PD_5]|nr:hypothetical protein FQN50_005428 [Emmonsiellopsis sp. PD_5]
MTAPLYHALVLGASGISGWAFVNQLLHDYPRSGTWAKVTGVTKRPMNAEEISYWPRDDDDQGRRLQLLSGVDFADDTEEEVRGKFVAGDADVEMVTHVYYLVSPPDAKALEALRKAVVVIDSLAPNLKFIHLQYGTFIYGTCFVDDFYMPVPLGVFAAPPQAMDRPATVFGSLRVDGEVLGFLPRPNSYNLAYPIAMFLSLYLYINGKGPGCPFPGSFVPEKSINGQGFNVASSSTPWNWERKWPAICSWFGLTGMPPVDCEKSKTATPSPDEYIRSHKEQFEKMVGEYGLKGWKVESPSMDGSENWGLTKLNFDRQVDLKKIKASGYTEEEDNLKTWTLALERMKAAKVIP